MIVRLASPADKTYFGPIAQTFALEAMRSGQVVFSDLHRSRFAGYIHLDMAIPIFSGSAAPVVGAPPVSRAGAGVVGVIDIEVTPDKFLYPASRVGPRPAPRPRPCWSGAKATRLFPR